MKILLAGLVLLGLMVAGGFALANYEGNHARVIEARVALEATRSARAANSTLIVVLVLIIVLLAVGIYVYFWLWAKMTEGMKRVGGERSRARLPGRAEAAPLQQSLQMQMLQMQMLQMLQMREQDTPVERMSLPEEW